MRKTHFRTWLLKNRHSYSSFNDFKKMVASNIETAYIPNTASAWKTHLEYMDADGDTIAILEHAWKVYKKWTDENSAMEIKK